MIVVSLPPPSLRGVGLPGVCRCRQCAHPERRGRKLSHKRTHRHSHRHRCSADSDITALATLEDSADCEPGCLQVGSCQITRGCWSQHHTSCTLPSIPDRLNFVVTIGRSAVHSSWIILDVAMAARHRGRGLLQSRNVSSSKGDGGTELGG
ncbi:hypothetical protein L226DRAFT_318474 [Lentinus tigrinus ALCF2SS1-7]|uniref:Uncharacterized protein n=1 Tax=Lentinus tigrinus ALCF2SS1-6 TaxID=1328759 RepID=A0A5C2S9C3_9APHY|nr:hypothetical protein L227DRAFT_114070 [Lentinus tigrinus ALCF2SS1-6]RPD68615.1 hypothetical protein L226DRAFT_318474 [Lentinus tigrinus ALCF2SS1-7]